MSEQTIQTAPQQCLLSSITTFKLGGPCWGIIHCQTPETLYKTILRFRTNKSPFRVIGEGSNILVSDKGLNCNIIRYFSYMPLIQIKDTTLYTSASTRLDDLALSSASHGLEGLMFANGIPGTVGGAITGNAGAFGKSIDNVLIQITALNKDNKIIKIPATDLDFNYRTSSINKKELIILSAEFNLKKGNKSALLEQRKETLTLRHQRHPNLIKTPCAGSFFKNIINTETGQKTSAGWYLDQANVKSLSHNGATVFDKHANIIIKANNNCSARDIYELSVMMENAVYDKFQIRLEREVGLLGEF